MVWALSFWAAQKRVKLPGQRSWRSISLVLISFRSPPVRGALPSAQQGCPMSPGLPWAPQPAKALQSLLPQGSPYLPLLTRFFSFPSLAFLC